MTQPIHRTAPLPRESLDAMERQLLDILDHAGPTSVRDLPVRWPLIRMHVPALLDRLAIAGLVRLAPFPARGGAVALTHGGREALRRADDRREDALRRASAARTGPETRPASYPFGRNSSRNGG